MKIYILNYCVGNQYIIWYPNNYKIVFFAFRLLSSSATEFEYLSLDSVLYGLMGESMKVALSDALKMVGIMPETTGDSDTPQASWDLYEMIQAFLQVCRMFCLFFLSFIWPITVKSE